MNYQESINRINNEMQQIRKAMQTQIQNNLSTDKFIKKMFNNYNIICL